MIYKINQYHYIENIRLLVATNKNYPYLILDEIGDYIFQLILKNKSIDNIAKNLVKIYNVSYEEVKQDIIFFIETLKLNGIIKKDDNNIKILEPINNNLRNFNIEKSFFYSNKPYKVFLEIISNCNLRCKHCYIDNFSYELINLEKCKKIIDQLYEMGVVELILTGGEVSLHPNLVDIISYASDKFLITILTNGTLLNKELIKKICSYKVYEVQISLYGYKEYHDNFVMQKGAYEKSLESLKYFRKYKGIGKASIVLNNLNFESIDILINTLNNLNIPYIMTPIIHSTINRNSKPNMYRVNSEQLKKFFTTYNIKIGGNICTAGISRFRITPKLDLVPCELLEHIKLGNLNNRDFKDLINSEERKKWIKFFNNLSGDKDCNKCNIKYNCPNCIGMNFSENNNYEIKNNFSCLIAKIQSENQN